MLAQRLRALEGAGILTRRTLPPPVAARVYALTEWGGELEPVLLALGRFGSRAALPDRPPPLSVDAAVLMLQPAYRRPAKGERFGLVLDGDRFAVETGGPALAARRGLAQDPVATVITDPATLVEVLFGATAANDAIASGGLEIDGDRAAAQRLLNTFAAPVPAPVAGA